MRTLSRALILVGSFSLLSACSMEEDSLGTKGDQQNGDDKCQGPDPSTLGCTDSSQCAKGSVCDPNACHPSTCSCDAESGTWMCTADCGMGACVPEDQQPVCEGPDPSAGCEAGCAPGTVCDPEACRPSACSCDAATGSWLCTSDCGSGGACVPDDSEACEGPNPADGCDNGCEAGTVCDPNACRPSSCGCDPATGYWQCTADCGSGGTCVPESQSACKGPNPADGCDNGCPDGTTCNPTACRPSVCACDVTTGSWLCTADCGSGGACVAN